MATKKPFKVICPQCGAIGYLKHAKYGIDSIDDVEILVSFNYQYVAVKCLKCGHSVGDIEQL